MGQPASYGKSWYQNEAKIFKQFRTIIVHSLFRIHDVIPQVVKLSDLVLCIYFVDKYLEFIKKSKPISFLQGHYPNFMAIGFLITVFSFQKIQQHLGKILKEVWGQELNQKAKNLIQRYSQMFYSTGIHHLRSFYATCLYVFSSKTIKNQTKQHRSQSFQIMLDGLRYSSVLSHDPFFINRIRRFVIRRERDIGAKIFIQEVKQWIRKVYRTQTSYN